LQEGGVFGMRKNVEPLIKGHETRASLQYSN